MMKMDTKSRIRRISLILFFAVFAAWVAFYFIISEHISGNTEQQMMMAADQIIERLGGEFSQAEKLSYSLANDADVQALIIEQNPDRFYPLSDRIENKLTAGMFNTDFIEHIIIYRTGRSPDGELLAHVAGADAYYFRLSGKLGNKSCSVLDGVVSALTLPSHLSVNLDNKKYIGYADEIALMTGEKSGASRSPNDELFVHVGAVVILIEEEKILEILRSYDQSGSLLVMIKANEEMVTANTDRLDLFLSGVNRRPIIQSHLGITPYEITVAADSTYFNASVVYFTIVAAITATIFAIVLLMYADILNKRFFRPMIQVISSIETLNTDVQTDSLSHVQSEEFDGLIDKINEMLFNLNKKNNEIKIAEIEKQKAIIFSLKKQINAHFTINTINAIRILIEHEELEKAETVAMGLTFLIRYAYDKDELITVWDELDILESYTAIMNGRYNDKLAVDLDFDDRLMDWRMPRMLLQPVIENSIVHGFKDMDSGCSISVKAEKRDDTMFFAISDNGCGISKDDLSALNERLGSDIQVTQGYENIALLNIKNRLHYYYGDVGQITIQSNAAGGISVFITIPCVRDADWSLHASGTTSPCDRGRLA
jgi:sensor histidine kinase YesM